MSCLPFAKPVLDIHSELIRRREALALLAGTAMPWPLPAKANQTMLDEAVGFAGRLLFLSLKIPALVIGVVRDGKASIHGFGTRAEASRAKPDGASIFRIGSITKTFTGQVLASLAADKIVGLADPLTAYVPDFAAPLSKAGRPIRLIDLATHSAGLPREVPHEPGPPDNPFLNITPAAFAAWLKRNPLLFTPGTAVLYSNFGFDLLAAALSVAAGRSYPDLLAERILDPLGLADTSSAPAAEAARLMQGHGFDDAPLPFVPTGDVIVGSGGLYSSARDLLRWLAWHLDRLRQRARRRAAHRPRRLSLARRASVGGRPGRVGPYGCDGSCVGRDGARGRPAAHPSEGRRIAGDLLLRRVCAGAQRRAHDRDQCVQRERRPRMANAANALIAELAPR